MANENYVWVHGYVPRGYWKNEENVKEYVYWLYKTLNFKGIDDWYNITKKHFSDNKGNGLLDRYNNSFHPILKLAYPDYNFLSWKFKHVPQGFWQDDNNIKMYLQWLLQQLGYKDHDFHKLIGKDLADNYGKGLLWTHKWKGSVSLLIKTLYDISDYDTMRKTKQYSRVAISWLERMQSKYDIKIQHAENGGEVTLDGIGKVDGYCKETNTIFEFHGRYYHGDPRMYNPDIINNKVKKTYRDLLRKTMVRYKTIIGKGYSYVHVWEDDWNNGTDESDVSLLSQDIEDYKIYALFNAQELVEYFRENQDIPSKEHSLYVWLSAYKSMQDTNIDYASIQEVEDILDEIPLWRTRRELMIKTLNAVEWINTFKRLPDSNADNEDERLHSVFLYNQKQTGTCEYVKQYLDVHVNNWKDVRGIQNLTQVALKKAEGVVLWFQENGQIPKRTNAASKNESKYAGWLYEQRRAVKCKEQNEFYRCTYYEQVVQYLDNNLPGWREGTL